MTRPERDSLIPDGLNCGCSLSLGGQCVLADPEPLQQPDSGLRAGTSQDGEGGMWTARHRRYLDYSTRLLGRNSYSLLVLRAMSSPVSARRRRGHSAEVAARVVQTKPCPPSRHFPPEPRSALIGPRTSGCRTSRESSIDHVLSDIYVRKREDDPLQTGKTTHPFAHPQACTWYLN